MQQPWGQWDWPLTLSSPERAVLELMDELPKRESFHQVDMLMEGLTSLNQILNSDRLRKLVIANPQHAPYGSIAKQYLQHIGMWDEINHKIVFANNASQATQFGLSGVADAAFIPLSQIKVMGTGNREKFVLIDQTGYEPLKHVMVLMRHAGQASRELQDFILGEKGQDILAGYGFAESGF